MNIKQMKAGGWVLTALVVTVVAGLVILHVNEDAPEYPPFDCRLFLPQLNESGSWFFINLSPQACETIEKRHRALGIYREDHNPYWFTLDQSSNWTWPSDNPKAHGGGGAAG